MEGRRISKYFIFSRREGRRESRAHTWVVEQHLGVGPLLGLHHIDHLLVREQFLLALVHGLARQNTSHPRNHFHHA